MCLNSPNRTVSRILATTIPIASLLLMMSGSPQASGQNFYIYDGGPTGTGLLLESPENWFKLPSSDDLLPIAGNGGGNAFIGAMGGAGGTERNLFLGDGVTPVSLDVVSELQVGTEANPYGQSGAILGGTASVAVRNGATLTVGGNVVIGQGRDNVNDNSGEIMVEAGGIFNHNADRVLIGFFDTDEFGATTGTLTLNGGTFNSLKGGNRVIVGGWDTGFGENFGRGVFNLNAGTANTRDVIIGAGGGSGVVNHTGGIWNVDGFFTTAAVGAIRSSTQGTYNLSGDPLTSVLNIAADFTIHEQGTAGTAAVSSFNQSGGTVNLNASGINTVGRASGGQGKGVYDLSGGVVNVNNANLNIAGNNTGSVGDLIVSGTGQLNLNNSTSLVLGQSGSSTGTVTQSGGSVTISPASTSGLFLAAGGGSGAVYNLNGGTLTLGRITAGLGIGSFNFDGGTLTANAPFVASGFVSTINPGGAFFDTNGNEVEWQPGFTGSGGLTKAGDGRLTLSGVNAYGGGTTVNGGILSITQYLDGSASVAADAELQVGATAQLNGLAIVNAGGTMSGSGTIVGGIVSDGAIAPGPGIATLFSGAVSLSETGLFVLELSTGDLTADLLSITGSLSLSDTDDTKLVITDLNPAAVPSGTYPFITYTGAWDGDLFAYAGQAVPDGGTVAVGSNFFTLDYNLGGNSVALISVPEPGSAVILLASFGALGIRRRRRD